VEWHYSGDRGCSVHAVYQGDLAKQVTIADGRDASAVPSDLGLPIDDHEELPSA
jgi:hypothetical protein